MAGKLKQGVLHLLDTVTIAVAGSAPAYSLNVTTVHLMAAVGLLAPAALLFAALPMFGIAFAFLSLSRWRADAGATYAWVGRSINPMLGFMVGWTVVITNVISMVVGALPLGTETLRLIGPWFHINFQKDLSPERYLALATSVAALWFVALAVPVFAGISLTARFQKVMTLIEVFGLGLVGMVAFTKGLFNPADKPFSWQWLNPLPLFTGGHFVEAMSIAIFFYWGWEISSHLSEESDAPKRSPGLGGLAGVAGIFALFLITQLGIQLSFDQATIADTKEAENLIQLLGEKVLPGPLGHFAVLAVFVSTLATMETSILQSSRTAFSMARDRVLDMRMGEIHPRYQTPWVGGMVLGLISLATFVLGAFQPNVGTLMSQLIDAIAIQVSISYGFSGLACAWFYRKTLFSSVQRLFTLGIWPLASGAFVLFIGYRAGTGLYSDPNTRHVFYFSIGTVLIGILPMLYYRFAYKSAYYQQPSQAAAVVNGQIALPPSEPAEA